MSRQESHVYCSYCGAKLASTAKFCSECGAPITAHKPVSESVATSLMKTSPVESSSVEPKSVEPVRGQPTLEGRPLEAMALFDQRRRYYLIDRGWWGTKFGDIVDENGNLIGHLYEDVDPERSVVELREADNQTVAALIHRDISAIPDIVEIQDGKEELLARVRHKILVVGQPEAWIESEQGKRILNAKGNFKNLSFDIFDTSGNLVAEIDKTSAWRDVFPSNITSGSD